VARSACTLHAEDAPGGKPCRPTATCTPTGLIVLSACSRTPCSCSLPAGVPPDMIDQYVQEIMNNREINIKALPDSIERIIYVSTIKLTLNSVLYRSTLAAVAIPLAHGTALSLVLKPCAVLYGL